MFKIPTLNKNKKEKDNTKKWKGFSVALNRFELDDVNDLKIIGKLVLELLISLRVLLTTRYFNPASQVAITRFFVWLGTCSKESSGAT